MRVRFRDRLLLLMVGMVLITGAITATAVLTTSKQQSLADAGQQLDTGARVLERLVEARAIMLANAVSALSGDFAFRQAVGTREQATIESMLLNHGNRISADLGIVMNLDGAVLATTDPTLIGSEFAFGDLLRVDDQRKPVTAIVSFGSSAYQIVVAPIFLPQQIGWACIGFRIDGVLVNELAGLTGVNVSFVSANGENSAISVFASTAPAAAMAYLSGAETASAAWLSAGVAIGDNAGRDVRGLVQISRQEVLSAYRKLRLRLLVVLVLAVVASIAIAMGVARRVTKPVTQLVGVAKRIRQGDYSASASIPRGDEFGMLAETLDSMRDGIAEREAQIRFQAEHDSLTGIANRDALRNHLQARIEAGRTFTLVALRLGRFQQINEALGGQLGDALLCEIAERLRALSDGVGLVARTGNRNFALVTDVADTEALVTQLQASLCAPILVSSVQAELTTVVGMAAFPQHADNADDLMRRADIALSSARDSVDGRAIYEPGEDEDRRRRLSIVSDLKSAIDAGQLYLFYQPKVSMRDRACHSVEALVRWQHPRYGFMPPDEFIGVAEQSGLIGYLTAWVIESAAAQVAVWDAQEMPVDVAVNLSAHDLADADLPQRLQECLARHGLAPQRFTLEITESAVISNAARATAMLQLLAERGFRIAIDDFGTGQSSMSQLGRLPANQLKIDKSFVMAMHDDDKVARIVGSMVELAQGMGMTVVAEGVETPGNWRMLSKLGCDEVQGYLLSRPVAPAQLEKWLLAHGKDGADNITEWSHAAQPGA